MTRIAWFSLSILVFCGCARFEAADGKRSFGSNVGLGNSASQPTPTPGPSATPTPNPSATPQPNSTPQATATPSPTATPRPTATPTATPMPTPPPAPSPAAGQLNVPIEVKETAGVGANGFPVAAVVPLPVGKYTDLSRFRVVTDAGLTAAAQFEVLNRWWGKDNSLRNIVVHFQPVVGAFTTAGTGVTKYYLRYDGNNIAPSAPAQVSETSTELAIATGATTIRIQKSPFRIITPAGDLKAVFTGKTAADLVESFNRSDIKLEIEERGPMRVVVKASSLTTYSSSNHRHGWAIRIYAYAGKPYVKVDYQLQNSAKNVRYGAALYFDSLNLEIATGVAASAASVRAELVNSDFSSKPPGVLKAPGVSAMIRNFYQTWPNGLSVDAGGKLKVELWPSWSAQYYEAKLSPTGLYWLEDMQQSYKEVLFDFGNRSASEISVLAKTFQYHPVATLPTAWYADSKATLDMDGTIPIRTKLAVPEKRRPTYSAGDYDATTDRDSVFRTYGFGWMNFGLDVERKVQTAMTGGYPEYNVRLIGSEDPADYFSADDRAAAEINIRPQWIAEYNYARDNSLLQLTENPYGEGIWRAFDDPVPPMAVPYMAGTGRAANARDDEHGWFYPAEFGYVVTGNLWVKDWYKFIAEFRKVRLNQADPYPDMSSRAMGHALSHAMQAYRVTGDPEILTLMKNYLAVHIKANLDPTTGVNITMRSEKWEASWQGAYLLRPLISLNSELASDDPAVLKIVRDYVNWNKNQGNYCNYCSTTLGGVAGTSNGSGEVFADIVAWYILKTGDTSALNHMRMYWSQGIPANTGEKAYSFSPYVMNSRPVWDFTWANRYLPLVY